MIHAIPKPAPTVKAPRKPLRAKKWGISTRPRKPLVKSGQTKAKKVIRQRAFYTSATWKRMRKETLERAGYQCEYVIPVESWYGIACCNASPGWRCDNTESLEVDHITSVRFGGDERPEDLRVLCIFHHRLIEAVDHPTRHRTHGMGA